MKGQTQEAADAAKSSTKQAAQHAKGKAEDVKGKAKETADQAKDKADEAAEGFTGWAKSWFGKSVDCYACCLSCQKGSSALLKHAECHTCCMRPNCCVNERLSAAAITAKGFFGRAVQDSAGFALVCSVALSLYLVPTCERVVG